MKMYTGWQWILIDVANHFGLDKLEFEDRIQWTEEHLSELELLVNEADCKPLFIKAVQALRDAQRGIPTGHRVGVDATCSGLQIMSVLTGCLSGATATGLVDPDRRADAYTDVTDVMNSILGGGLLVIRPDAKKATMTSLYGSKAKPKEIFGEGTEELKAFFEGVQEVAPGAWNLLQELLESWRPYALEHYWKMPDGFDVLIRVMSKQDTRIEVDELDHATFTYEYYENVGQLKGRSNAGNVIHSVDSFVLREMHRRCNYNPDVVNYVYAVIQGEFSRRKTGIPEEEASGKIKYYIDQYLRSSTPSAVILPWINTDTVRYIPWDMLVDLNSICKGMLQHNPFELVTIHDEFTAHANNINWVRWHYREILVELADGDLLQDIFSQIYGESITYNKLSNNLGRLISKSEYALC